LDLDSFHQNLATMQESLASFPNVSVRAHFKAHKCLAIADLQRRLSGVQGFCCQKAFEAETLLNGGFTDVYLSNEVVDINKLRRLFELAKEKGAKISLCADSVQGVFNIDTAASEAGLMNIGVLVDCNVGQNRCGTNGPEEALMVGLTIKNSKNLVFKGIQAYHGGAQHIRSYLERKTSSEMVAEKVREILSLLSQNGLNSEVVTGGGTGTYLFDAATGVFTEVQPGSYIFNDVDYSKNYDQNGDYVSDWKHSLFILTSVMNHSTTSDSRWFTLDAGLKAYSVDSGAPIHRDMKDVELVNAGDEHTKAIISNLNTEFPPINSRHYVIPAHCDPTVNLYDTIVAFRGENVEAVWRIEGRGPGF